MTRTSACVSAGRVRTLWEMRRPAQHVGWRSSRKGCLFSLVKPRSPVLDTLVRDHREMPTTYPDVGGTRAGLPPEYHHVRQVVELGGGDTVFQRAVEGLRQWQGHLLGGVDVAPHGAPVEEGTVLALAVRIVPVYITVVCRVIYVTEHPTQFAFAYGTLPHHLIEGEEAFVVERDHNDAVHFSVVAFFKPRGRAMRSVAPLVHLIDQRLVQRYLRGMQRHVAQGREDLGR